MDRDLASTNSALPDPSLASASGSLHQILTSDDPLHAARQILRACARALDPARLFVYRVDRHGPEGELECEPDRALTPGALLEPDVDKTVRHKISTRVDGLSHGAAAEFTIDGATSRDVSRSSALAIPVMVERKLVAVVLCISPAALAGWAGEKHSLAEIAADAISISTLRNLARQHARLEATLAYSFDIMAVVGADGSITSHTPNASQVFGGSLENLAKDDPASPIHPQDRTRVAQVFTEILENPGGQRRIELRLKHADGSWRQFEAVGTNQIDNPLIRGIVVTAHDVTDRKRLEEWLHWQALHDPLTKLANRALLLNDLRRALARSERSGEKTGILYLDLDGFKEINDHFGHSTGDQLLIQIGDRLRASVRAGETVARLGGDEFIVLLEGLSSLNDAERAASRILDAIRIPVSLASGSVTITASLGISLASSQTIDPDDLLAQADTALYAAKHAGRNQFQTHHAWTLQDNRSF